jgi:hypothetical protein
MNKLDETIQRLLWSEMKDPVEFRAYLEREGYEIITACDTDRKPATETRYVPWLLRDTPGATWPWGIKDLHSGVNVLSDFLPDPSGAFSVLTREEAEVLIQCGRKRGGNKGELR